jgi:SAM-dependent methyltransferase
VTVAEPYSWVPDGVDVTVPNAARVYDFALGGVHNFQVDREFWSRAERAFPEARLVARANRAFLGRAVRWLAESGVRQFLDLGSGIPTLGNVHEVAQAIDPRARVMYVDVDPIAVEQSRHLLTGNRYARAMEGDLRDPDKILFDPRVLDFLDFGEPVAVLTVAVLHFLPDSEQAAGILRRVGASLVSGSHLVVSHAGPDPTPEGRARQEIARKLYEHTRTPVVIRTAEEVTALVGDSFEVLPPGVVSAGEWHPDPDAEDGPPQPTALVAVARKR